jgi:hypothetical protein
MRVNQNSQFWFTKKTKKLPPKMKIQKIIGENGTLPALCNGGTCPAAVITESGDVFVQGFTPAQTENNELKAPAGEGFVKMSRTTFEKIARQVLAA